MIAALRGIGIVAALILAVVHGYLVPEHLEEMFYIGVLFAIATVLLLVAVAGLLTPRGHQLGWWLGSLVSAGMFIGYILSRTVGLPQGYLESWDEPLGTLSLVCEAIFLAAAVLVARKRVRRGRRVAAA